MCQGVQRVLRPDWGKFTHGMERRRTRAGWTSEGRSVLDKRNGARKVMSAGAKAGSSARHTEALSTPTHT